MTADDKYSLLNKGNLLQYFQTQFSKNPNIFPRPFLSFSKSILNFEHIQGKRWPSYLMYFWTYGLRKTCLDKCLKDPLSEDPSITNMVNGSKHCSNLNDNTFTIFINHCHCNSGWKSLSEWYAKSEDSLLTLWLPMTSILFLTELIYYNIFRCNYLRSERYFLNLFFS